MKIMDMFRIESEIKTLGAEKAMLDLWAKHHGERKTSITLTDAECFAERLKQPRINKGKRMYENKDNQDLFHLFLDRTDKNRANSDSQKTEMR